MYRFESNLDAQDLDMRYKAIYAKAKIKEKWDNAVKVCPELALTLPDKVIPTDMLTMKYEKLVEVYLLYRQLSNRLTDDRRDALNESASKVFNYDTHKNKIKRFLMDANNGFEINNCVYCDLHDARTFGEGHRQFATEHILDKGKCPLVGLSLYNFCPACDTCNTVLKGTKPIGGSEAQMKKLSPTSRQYDFQHQVRFVLIEMPEAIAGINFGHPEFYEIDFEYKDDDYREVTTLFNLKERYNLPNNKRIALDWREKVIKHRGIDIALKASLTNKSKEEVIEDLFNLRWYRKDHVLGLKLIEDIVGTLII